MKSKTIIPLTFALFGLSNEIKADGIEKITNKSIYEVIAENGYARIEDIAGKGKNLFNPFDLRGITREGKTVDLSSGDFRAFLKNRYDAKGDSLASFVNQAGAEHFGIVTDESNNTFLCAPERVVVSPDSVKLRVMKLPENLGRDLNRVASGLDPVKSALARMNNGYNTEFEIVGQDAEFALENLRYDVQRAFNLNPLMSEKDLQRFTEASRVDEIIKGIFSEEEAKKTFEESLYNNLRVRYSLGAGGYPTITACVVDKKGNELYNSVPYQGAAIPTIENTGEFSFANNEDLRSLGLEGIVVANADTSARPDTSVIAERRAPKTPKGAVLNFVVGGGYPTRAIAGFNKSFGDWVVETYGGVRMPEDNREETERSTANSTGLYHEIQTDLNEQRKGIFAGLGLGYRLTENLSFVAGGEAGVDRTLTNGKAVARRYDKEGAVVGRNPDQVITNTELRRRLGINAGIDYKGFGFRGLYDSDTKMYGGEVRIPIIRRK